MIEFRYTMVYPVSGIVNGSSAELTFYEGQIYIESTTYPAPDMPPATATLINNGNVLRMVQSDGYMDFYRE
jgi:hypothetical protein